MLGAPPRASIGRCKAALHRGLAFGFSIAVVLGSAACTAALLRDDDALSAIPYEILGNGHVVIEATINDRGPFRLAIDTAASISFIVDDLVEELDLTERFASMATVHGLLVSGRYPAYSIDRIGLGTMTHLAQFVVALPQGAAQTGDFDGVLGTDVLGGYGLEFDRRERVLRIYPGSILSARSFRGWSELSLRSNTIGDSTGALFFLDIEIGERHLPALLDLGAGVNVLNRPAADWLGLQASNDDDSTSTLAGALATRPTLVQLTSQDVMTAGVTWRNEVFLVADLDIFEVLGFSERPLAIVGSGLFGQRSFIVDPQSSRLLIRTSSEIDRVY